MGTLGGLLIMAGLGCSVAFGDPSSPFLNRGEALAAVCLYVGSACVTIAVGIWLWGLL